MARLNTRPSSRYNSVTPGPGNTSDQENTDPIATRTNKGKGRASDMPPPSRASLPTPTSDSSNEARGQKRKRAVPQRSSTEADDDEEDVEEEDREAAKFTRYFDPNQDPDERREIKRESRALEREFQENRDDLLRDSGKGLTKTIRKANKIYRNVKQTNDATLDSRLLVNVSDLAYKKTAQLVIGDNSVGVDVDEFLSKCITYMRNGGPLDRDEQNAAPRRRRTQTRDDSDDEDEDDIIGGPLDWEVFGRNACFPFNARPCVPSFLLGPLSVEKKHRTQTQRRARQTKDTAGREARPEALSREDLSNADENALTAVCQRINKRLRNHVNRAERTLGEAGFQSVEDLNSARGKAMLKQLRVTNTGGPSLFETVLNPQSFGQTVENLFYVSFLIKEGAVGIQNDSEGLPTLVPSEASTVEELRQKKISKHQAVFSLDYETYQQLIDAFHITEPLIEHRQDDAEARAQRMGERGWYT